MADSKIALKNFFERIFKLVFLAKNNLKFLNKFRLF